MTDIVQRPLARRSLKSRFGYEERSAALFLAPVMTVLMGVAVFPILYSFYVSFFEILLIIMAAKRLPRGEFAK